MALYTKIIDLQKLRLAWRQVYKNKPKEGVDEITCEEFEANREMYLKQLAVELQNHAYVCQAVRLIPLYKGEKVRYVSLYCMRDKVVQCSMAAELASLYEPSFPGSSYAYRQGKSALNAAQDICGYIGRISGGYVLKADIHAFFDCIIHERLFLELRRRIREEDVLELLQQIIRTPSLDRDGALTDKRRGLYQGSSVAPVLSNIYLMELDAKIASETPFYVRYSDDLLLIFRELGEAETYREQLGLYFKPLGLELNREKTEIASLEEGFEFLGYRFDKNGMNTPDKAKDQLNERLEEVWLNPAYSSFDERMKKALEIVNGWEQYFPEQTRFGGILEYTVWVYRQKKTGYPEKMKELRGNMENPYKDVAAYLAGLWKKWGMPEQCLREYEMYYGLPERCEERLADPVRPFAAELVELYEKYIVQEAPEIRTELIQLYTDMKKYQNAAALTGQGKASPYPEAEAPAMRFREAEYQEEAILLTQAELDRYMELFAGREDIYAVDEMAESGRRICEEVEAPLLPDVVKDHLAGKTTVNTYVQRGNSTVKYLVIDLDISKSVLLQEKEGLKEEYMDKCFRVAKKFRSELDHMGLCGYLEKSGCRGFHIWLFFEEWIPVRYVNMLTDLIDARTRGFLHDGGLQVEYFPNKTKVRNGKKGQCIKFPWGIHPRTGRKSLFLEETGEPVRQQAKILEEIVRYPLHTVKKLLAAAQGKNVSGGQAGSRFACERPIAQAGGGFAGEKISGQPGDGSGESQLGILEAQVRGVRQGTEVDRELAEFGMLPDTVRAVLEGCSLMRYLCQKARKTHYLTHMERLTILYVFGHLGEDGEDFVHRVMAFTLNYSEQVTQKFIRRLPEKPISCIKLREQYKQISAEIGCTCNFHRTKNCYPSPVLHALKKSDDNSSVTMPLSRTVPADKQTLLKNEINVAVKVQEIAEKLIELRKQKRSLEKAVRKCEQELAVLFDENHTDSMEIKMGLLIRRKGEEGVEWRIEL